MITHNVYWPLLKTQTSIDISGDKVNNNFTAMTVTDTALVANKMAFKRVVNWYTYYTLKAVKQQTFRPIKKALIRDANSIHQH